MYLTKSQTCEGIKVIVGITIAAITVLALSCAMEGEHKRAGVRVTPPEGFKEVGGSNYTTYRVDESYRVRNEPGSWWRPGVLEVVVGYYHLQKPGLIQEQLRTMYENGQRKIALFIWVLEFSPKSANKDKAVDGVYGHCLVLDKGHLRQQHRENLRGLIRTISRSGYFNELNFRLAHQGSACPKNWKEWNEAMYQRNWETFVVFREIVEEELSGSGMKVVYDLGAELGGLTVGEVPEYSKRMWSDYTRIFGNKDTCGFSFATYPGRMANMLKIFEEVGV